MKNYTASVNITINASSQQVWEALTSPEMIKEYFFGTRTKTTWKVGDPITFEGEYQGKKYHDKGEVLRFEPEKLLQYTYWSSMGGLEDKPENYVTVSFIVKEDGGQTTLEVVQENIPGEKMQEHAEGQWKQVLGNIKQLLENKTVVSTGL